ncbi:ornithine cyclodeaminase/alanine dehydrogenase-like protein (mu-crystallin family) [Rhodovulum iodosum]|uniref:Ornithine cyclodeaminase/alanine dehydrogenase-like protein (Mu-crystallin family) n=1 Tax=Rhodovulum iodosum TaxID=68291 RepID=A0ABV3XXK3_9RHOB|nr:ornithine cyclodeaminase [Rhodovulum robiginosum]RSK38075.1 ornithine cyclodeaminase [Rhodovulum robiginosum]
MPPELIDYATGEPLLDWIALTEALEAGHSLPRAEIADSFLYRGSDTMLNRAAWIEGLGIAVKTATVFPGNPTHDKPAVNGGMCLYSNCDGLLEAIVDFHLVTKWKTAGDSLLAARKLARPDSERILIVGAGTVAHSLYEAYFAAFPKARFTVWNRSAAGAQRLASAFPDIEVAPDLEAAVRAADIVTSATMATAPLIMGDWLRPGQHIDLIGAFRPDMREADDAALKRARIFVDSRATTLDHIGELKIPLEAGAIGREDVVADYYDLPSGDFARRSDDEITLFKNGGGAHLDLMSGRYILGAWRAR